MNDPRPSSQRPAECHGTLRRLIATLFLPFAVAGCLRQDEPSSTDLTVPAADEQPLIVTLREIAGAGLRQFVAAHRGQVVLVDFWATWCTTCLSDFPHTLALQRQFADQGLVAASVALDDPAGRDRVVEFLRERGATIPNFLAPQGADTAAAMADFQIASGIAVHGILRPGFD